MCSTLSHLSARQIRQIRHWTKSLIRVWKGGSWSRIPAPFSRESRIPHFLHRYPEFRFFSPKIHLKRLISAKAHKFKMQIGPFHWYFVLAWLIRFCRYNVFWVVTISRICGRQATKSRIPCPNFGESRFPGSSQIPNPVKIFLFSRIPHRILVKSRIPRIPFQTLFDGNGRFCTREALSVWDKLGQTAISSSV